MSMGPSGPRGAQARHDGNYPSMTTYGVGDAGSRPIINAFGEVAAPPKDMRGLMQQVYSFGVTQSEQDFNGRYHVETEDFPDIFGMPEFEEVFMARVNSKTTWINEVMPAKRVYQLEVKGDALIFNHTQPERMPEESVPNYMSWERESYSDTIVRWGKGLTIESNLFHTPYGRALFSLQMEQLNNAIMLAQNHSCLCALYYDERARIKTRSDLMIEAHNKLGAGSSGAQLLKEHFKNFGVLNRHPLKIKERIAQWTLQFEDQCDGRAPNRIVFPKGSHFTWEHANLGDYSQTGYRMGDNPNLQKIGAGGIKYNESFGTRLDDGRINHDPSFNDRTVGGYFVINYEGMMEGKYTNDASTVEIFDEAQDQMAKIRLSQVFGYTGMWENYENCDSGDANEEESRLTDVGLAYLDGVTNYYDWYKRQAPQRELDAICTKIRTNTTFMAKLAERVIKNKTLRESSGSIAPSDVLQRIKQLVPNVHVRANLKVSARANQPVFDGLNPERFDPSAPQNIPPPDDDRDEYADPNTGISRREELKDNEARAIQRSRTAGRASGDWLSEMTKRYDVKITPKLRSLFNDIASLPNAAVVLNEWKDAVEESDGEDFYVLGKKVYINVVVNRSLENAIKKAKTPNSAMEKFLKLQNPRYFDQVFLDEISDELNNIQEKEVQYLQLNLLNLYTNDEPRTLKFPALLFPLTTSNVVLFQPEDISFLADSNWAKKAINREGNASLSFYNDSSRMAMLFHSIEVSVIYAVLESGEKYDNLVQTVSPNPSLIDWTTQIRSVRASNMKVAPFQSDYSDVVEFIRAYIRQPSPTAFKKLQNQFAQAQSGTSAQVGSGRYKLQGLLQIFNEAMKSLIDGKTVNLGATVAAFRAAGFGSAEDNVINNPTEVSLPIQNHFWALINGMTDISDAKLSPFIKALARNVVLLNVTTPRLRFVSTPMEHIEPHQIVRVYIDNAVASFLIDDVQALKDLDSDVTMLVSNKPDDGKAFIQLFSGLMKRVTVQLTETYPSLNSATRKQFSNFRLTGKVNRPRLDNAIVQNFINSLKWIDERPYGISLSTVKTQAQDLCNYALQIAGTQKKDNIIGQLYRGTSIATRYPDLRECTSQAIAAMLVFISRFRIFANVGDGTPSMARIEEVIKQYKESVFVNGGHIGPGNADQNKVEQVAKALATNAPNVYGEPLLLGQAEVTAPISPDNNWSEDPTNDDVIILLKYTSTEDAWLYKQTFENDIPPPAGVIGDRPCATYEMGTLLLLIDREVGGMHYIPPNITVGEDPKQQMMHMTFGMYYKGIIRSGKHVLRIHDVYCRKYKGGNSIQPWDPRNYDHRAMYSNSTRNNDTARDIFYRPIDYWSYNYGGVRDITGAFAVEFPTTELEQKYCEDKTAAILCEIWGWSNEACMKPDSYKAMSRWCPRFNTLVCQDHTGLWDGKGGWTRIIKNRGAWGENIYPGCSADRCAGTLDQNRM